MVYKKDGSLDKRFKENKGLDNFDIFGAMGELAELRNELEKKEFQEKLFLNTKLNFLKRSDHIELINEVATLTKDLSKYCTFDFISGSLNISMFESDFKIGWFHEDLLKGVHPDHIPKAFEFPYYFNRNVIEAFFGGGIIWDPLFSENEAAEHLSFKEKLNRLGAIVDELLELEEATLKEIREKEWAALEKERAKKTRIITEYGYCYHYDRNPIDLAKFKKMKAEHDSFEDFLDYGIKDIYNDRIHNFCLKYLSQEELILLENRCLLDPNDTSEDRYITDEALYESIQLEKKRRSPINLIRKFINQYRNKFNY